MTEFSSLKQLHKLITYFYMYETLSIEFDQLE